MPKSKKKAEEPKVSTSTILRQVLWIRKPPLREDQINEIIAETRKGTPLEQVLRRYPFIADREQIIKEIQYLTDQNPQTELESAKSLRAYRMGKGLQA